MNTSQAGIDLIKKFEGCRLTAYKDSVGVWTIGYGHTRGVYEGLTITQAYAVELLREDLKSAEKNVRSYNAIYHWTQNEFDALASFAFNIGSINGLTKQGARSKTEISRKILEYNKAGGRVLSGLTARRKAEKKMFDESKGSVEMPTIRKGDTGTPVKIWQLLIGEKVDGIFGDKTEQTTIKVQMELFAEKIEWDGVVGKKTWDEMVRKK